MPDLFEQMNKNTGIPRAELEGIWEAVKVNQGRLESCAGPHDFLTVPGNARRLRCARCGGEMSPSDVFTYTRGLEHGRKEASHG